MAPKRTSDVWKYFESVGSSEVRCKESNCGRILKKSEGSTSSMKRHLEAAHDISVEKKRKTQHTIDVFMCRKERNEMLNRKYVLFLCKDLRPFSLGECEGGKAFFEDLGYFPPSRNKIKDILLFFYEIGKEEVKKQAKLLEFPVMTCDLWTSRACESFIAVNIHGISGSWDMKKFTIGCFKHKESHTSDNIRKLVNEILAKFEIFPTFVVTDSGRNIIKAFSDYNQIKCFAHVLQLIINESLSSSTLENILAKCRKIVAHFSHSTTATENLKELGTLQLKLIQDVKTRWNSTFYMLERIHVLRGDLAQYFSTMSQFSCLWMSPDEFEILNNVMRLLKPFEEATRLLTSEKYVTLSLVYPIIRSLSSKLESEISNSEDDSISSLFSKSLLEGLRKRTAIVSDKESTTWKSILLCSIMDPKWRQLRFFSKIDRKKCRKTLKTEMNSMVPKTIISVKKSSDQENTSTRNSYLFDSMPDYGSSSEDEQLKSNISYSKIEYTAYLAEEENNESGLEFWKKNETKFPILARLAKKYLGIPATSASVERLFRTSALTVTPLRSSLNSKTIEKIVFVHQNYDILRQLESMQRHF